MCIKFFKRLPVVKQMMNPALSELAPLPEYQVNNHLYGLAYTGGFNQFSQNNGYLPFANQSVTPETLGLLNGQYYGQPLVGG